MMWKPIDEKAKDGRWYLFRARDRKSSPLTATLAYRPNAGRFLSDTFRCLTEESVRQRFDKYMDVPGLNGEEVPEPVYAWAVRPTEESSIAVWRFFTNEPEAATYLTGDGRYSPDHWGIVRVRIEEVSDA